MTAVTTAQPAPSGLRPALALAALGVVYGDIGTSPLYAFRETLNPAHGVPLTHESVLGMLSLAIMVAIVILGLVLGKE